MSPYTRLHNLAEAISKSGLSESTLRILAYLGVVGSASRERLAKALVINPTSLPRYMAAVVKSGHVAKTASQEDGRAVMFALSAHGKRLVDALCLHFVSTHE